MPVSTRTTSPRSPRKSIDATTAIVDAPASIVKADDAPAPLPFVLPAARAGATDADSYAFGLSFPRWKSSEAYMTRNNPDPREWTRKGLPVSASEQGTSSRSLVVAHDAKGFVRIIRPAVPLELGKGVDATGAPLPPCPVALQTPASMLAGNDSVITIDALSLGVHPDAVPAFADFVAKLLFGAGIRTTTLEARKAAREAESTRSIAEQRKAAADAFRNGLAYVVNAGKGDAMAQAVASSMLMPVEAGKDSPLAHGLASALALGWTPDPKSIALMGKAQAGKLPAPLLDALQAIGATMEAAKSAAAASPAPAPAPDSGKADPAPASTDAPAPVDSDAAQDSDDSDDSDDSQD